jgi:ABC-type amino acid transport substrate-binding protein
MARTKHHYLLTTAVALGICCIAVFSPVPANAAEEEYPGQGKDQLVDALDAAIARVIDSGRWREIINSDPVAAPLIVNIGDCYPRITDGDDEIYPFPENPTGLLADILSTKAIRMGTFDVVTTPGTFHVFDKVNPALMRAIIDELGKGYAIPPSPDPGAIQIVPVFLSVPSSSLVFTGLNKGDFDITDFLGALGATASVDGVEQRRRKLARFTCTVFGTPWYIHVKNTSTYQTFDDVLADTSADLCVGQLSARLSEDYFKNARSIDQKFTTDDLTECSQGVSDGTYDAYLHFDPVPILPDLRVIDMQIVSGIPIWVAGKSSDAAASTTTTSEPASCPSEEIYGVNAEETALIRKLRDEVLNKTVTGRAFVKLYYQMSPALLQAMTESKAFKQEVREILDLIMPVLREEMP